MARRFWVETLGCPKNQVDSDKILGTLIADGMVPADDASQAETPDGFMYHTDTSKTESIHLPTAASVTWTVTPEDATQVEFIDAMDVTMTDGTVHHVITFKPLTSGVIAKVKLEKREGANPEGPVVETRTVNVMIH